MVALIGWSTVLPVIYEVPFTWLERPTALLATSSIEVVLKTCAIRGLRALLCLYRVQLMYRTGECHHLTPTPLGVPRPPLTYVALTNACSIQAATHYLCLTWKSRDSRTRLVALHPIFSVRASVVRAGPALRPGITRERFFFCEM